MARATSQKEHGRKFRQAEREIDACMARIARTVTSLRHWQKRSRYHGREMQIDDATRAARTAALRESRKAKVKTRAIDVED